MKLYLGCLLFGIYLASTYGTIEAPTNEDDEGRIIGGIPTNPKIAPWAVYLKTYDAAGDLIDTCGGTVINTTIILTSAYCVIGGSTVKVYAGNVDRTKAKMTIWGVPIWHHKFGKNSYENDIAIVKLSSALDFDDDIQAIAYPGKGLLKADGLAGLKILSWGWGLSAKDAKNDEIYLNQLEMTVMKVADCAKVLKTTQYLLPSTAFCANTTGNYGICDSDYGGAVTYVDPKTRVTYIVGISSDYIGCPSSMPNIFTALLPFVDWIKAHGGPTAGA